MGWAQQRPWSPTTMLMRLRRIVEPMKPGRALLPAHGRTDPPKCRRDTWNDRIKCLPCCGIRGALARLCFTLLMVVRGQEATEGYLTQMMLVVLFVRETICETGATNRLGSPQSSSVSTMPRQFIPKASHLFAFSSKMAISHVCLDSIAGTTLRNRNQGSSGHTCTE